MFLLNVVLESDELPPGQRTTVKMEADLRLANGARRLTCTVQGENRDGIGYTWNCEGVAQVLPRVEIDQADMKFDNCTIGTPYSKYMDLTLRRRPEEDAWTIKGLVNSTMDSVLSALEETCSEEIEFPRILKTRVRLKVTIPNPTFPGFATNTVYLAQGTVQKDIHISARWYVASRFAIEPARAFFRVTGASDQSSQAIIISRKDGSEFRITKLISTTPAVEVRAHADGRLNKPSIIVSPRANLEKGFYHGAIEVLTDCPDEQSLRVPVSVFCVPASSVPKTESNTNPRLNGG